MVKKFDIKALSGREVLLFLFFVLVACCLWLMLTLNQNYETDIKFDISLKDVPADVKLPEKEGTFIVRVRDRGTTLMNYALDEFLPLSFEYRDLAARKGRIALPASVVTKKVKKQLHSSTAIVSVHPDTLYFYTQESAVKYPVCLNANVVSAREYAIGSVMVSPDSVWVFAPASVIDTLKYISTELVEKSDARDTLSLKVALDVPRGVTCNPAEVAVTVPVFPVTQKSFYIPVKGIDFPDTYGLRTFPPRVRVQVNVSLDNYDLVNAEDFEVGISYLDVYGSDDNRAKLRLLRAPQGVKDVRITPVEVDYIIEEK